jgi:hypothetical protein
MKQSNNHLARLLRPAASSLLAVIIFLPGMPALADSNLLGSDMGISTSHPPVNNMVDDSRNSSRNAEPPAPKITPAEAAERVRRATGGQVMGVNSLRTENGLVYGVKVLNSGHMRVVRVDSQTGQIINH